MSERIEELKVVCGLYTEKLELNYMWVWQRANELKKKALDDNVMNPQSISNMKNLSTMGGPVAPNRDMSRNACKIFTFDIVSTRDI